MKARTNDVETHYERRGDGPPIVFVHGAVMDHSMWTPQLESLSDEYETIAYDVRGHGRTGGSSIDRYSVDLFADDLHALVVALKLDGPVVCGLSMGGCIAQAYAARYPDALSGLVLADTFTPELSTLRERLQLASLRTAIPFVRLVGYPRVQRALTWVNERFNRGVSGDYGKIERLQAEAPEIGTDEFAKVIRSLVAFPESDVDFAKIAVPTLILYGENEPSFVRRQAGILEAKIPDAAVRVVPGAGHASNLDDAEFFTTAVREFIEREVVPGIDRPP